jgi:hypothetical protein
MLLHRMGTDRSVDGLMDWMNGMANEWTRGSLEVWKDKWMAICV